MIKKHLRRKNSRHASLIRSSYGRRLRAEQLEARQMLTAVTVGNALDVVNAPDTSSIAALVASDGGDGISLREAITAANNDANDPSDTIEFDPGVFGTPQTITLGGTQLSITDSLSIIGPGQDLLTIRGGGASRVLNIDDGNASNLLDVSLSDLVISNGNADDLSNEFSRGGGIFSRENLSITRATIRDNRAEGDGGGIWIGNQFSNPATLTLTESTISGNSSGRDASYGGGGLLVRYANSIITDSTISDNFSIADDGDGGGGGVYFYSGSHVVSGSTISGNRADQFSSSGSSGGGGGIHSTASVTIRHSTITGNMATSSLGSSFYGGGIYGGVTLEHTIVAGNTAEDGDNDIHGSVTASYSLIEDTAGATITDNGGVITGVPANLGPLQNNGGPTATRALLAASPAINAGDPAAVAGVGTVPLFDQRGTGFDRVLDGRIDIGAVEFEFPSQGLVVSTALDENDGDYSMDDLSLREAIHLANAFVGDTITFGSLFDTAQTINLASQLPTISDNVTITGPGADLLTIDAGGGTDGTIGNSDGFRIFELNDGDLGNLITVNLSGVTLTGADAAGDGGAILNVRERLNLNRSAITANAADNGGGIFGDQDSFVTIIDSTLSGNIAAQQGGAVFNNNQLNVRNSTISGNSATSGGGVANNAFFRLENSTLSGNTATSGGGILNNQLDSRLYGSIVANSTGGDIVIQGGGVFGNHNLIEDGSGGLADTITGDPLLGPPADNGGTTLTHLPQAGSPVIDAGDPNAIPGIGQVPVFDQRGSGFDRVRGTAIDIGAVEDQTSTLPVFSSPNARNVVENTTPVHTLTVIDIPGQSVDFRILGEAPAGDLGPGQSLEFDETITSPDGAATLIMQADGNLVVYQGGVPTWAAGTNPLGAVRTTIQADGNLVITDGGGTVVYQTGSGSDAGSFARLRVTNDGVPEIVRVDGEVLWRGALGNGGGAGTVFTPGALAPEFNQAADTDLFQISAGDQLQFIAAPNFENRTDANGDNVYEVTVLADDGAGGVTPQTIFVTATDFSEPGSLIVTTADDVVDEEDLATSLREAIAFANAQPGNDTITFDASIFNGEAADVIRLQSGQLSIAEGVHIDGRALDVVITADAAGDDVLVPGTFITDIAASDAVGALADNNGRVFEVASGDIQLTGLTITGGDVAGQGGGIDGNGGTLVIQRSTISGNRASVSGGGVSSLQDLTIADSTLSGNASNNYGGAIFVELGDVQLANSTVSSNAANGDGGGIATLFGSATFSNSTVTANDAGGSGGGIILDILNVAPDESLTLVNSIVAGNFAASVASDVDIDPFAPQSVSFSLIGGDPLIGPLADNGGPTFTHALLAGSPAIDAGDPAAVAGQNGVPEFDQRGAGFARVLNGRIDIGAYEAEVAPSADFNGDGNVRGSDFLAWQRGFGATTGAAKSDGDADNDADVDSGDLSIWESQFGQPTTSSSAAATQAPTGEPVAATALTAELVDAAIALESTSDVDSEPELALDDGLLVESDRHSRFQSRARAPWSTAQQEEFTSTTSEEARPDDAAAPWLVDDLLELVFTQTEN